MEREVVRTNDEMVKLCGDACFNAFKFVSSVDTQVIQPLIFSMTENYEITGLPSVPEAF